MCALKLCMLPVAAPSLLKCVVNRMISLHSEMRRLACPPLVPRPPCTQRANEIHNNSLIQLKIFIFEAWQLVDVSLTNPSAPYIYNAHANSSTAQHSVYIPTLTRRDIYMSTINLAGNWAICSHCQHKPGGDFIE